jgi:hypothetical protein
LVARNPGGSQRVEKAIQDRHRLDSRPLTTEDDLMAAERSVEQKIVLVQEVVLAEELELVEKVKVAQ